LPNWGEVLGQINQLRSQAQAHGRAAVDHVRRDYLKKLQTKTQRNVIAYYSGFLSKPYTFGMEINDEDKNGFMMAVHNLDKNIGLDLILHTPGGNFAATQSIVDYLQKMFKQDIRTIVPQIAMSAGTMIACCSKRILMTEHANLGPIDPQLRGVPAHGVIKEFKSALQDIGKDPNRIKVWQPILGQYKPTFLGQCQNAIDMSEAFVEEQLRKVMFAGEKPAKAKAKAAAVVKALADYSSNKAHDRHIHMAECKKIGLTVDRIEDDQDLQDLVVTVHHCYMHSLMNTGSFKIIENHNGSAFVKQQVQVAVPMQPGG
jgi:ATP-dependent protease ClpP protease subunit